MCEHSDFCRTSTENRIALTGFWERELIEKGKYWRTRFGNMNNSSITLQLPRTKLFYCFDIKYCYDEAKVLQKTVKFKL